MRSRVLLGSLFFFMSKSWFKGMLQAHKKFRSIKLNLPRRLRRRESGMAVAEPDCRIATNDFSQIQLSNTDKILLSGYLIPSSEKASTNGVFMWILVL